MEEKILYVLILPARRSDGTWSPTVFIYNKVQTVIASRGPDLIKYRIQFVSLCDARTYAKQNFV